MRRGRRIGLAVLALLILAELGLRYGVGLGDPPLVTRDPQVEYRLVPSANYSRFGNRIEINSHGMRAPEHPARAETSERRVLLIGDSVIYGNHFLDQTETIALQMTDQLRGRAQLAGCIPRVMPAAASSWGPVNQAAFLADIGVLGADTAILVVSSHDLYDTPSGQSIIPYRLRPPIGALGDAVEAVYERLARRYFPPAPDTPRPPRDVRRAETLIALDRIHVRLLSEGVPLTLAYHPIISERENGLRDEHAVFANWAADKGIVFVTLEDPALTQVLYRDQIHPLAPGAAILAQTLADIAINQLDPCPA